MLLSVLSQFLYRLSFGLAVSMIATPIRWVPSGFFRIHSYVLLGLNVTAAAIAFGASSHANRWLPVVAVAASYASSAAWLYRRAGIGLTALVIVAAASLAGSLDERRLPANDSPAIYAISLLDAPTGGLVLGTTMAAMLLGHWYLNNPMMKLDPLKRLLNLMAWAVLAKAVVAGSGLAFLLGTGVTRMPSGWLLALRWTAGIVGVLALVWLGRQTVKIPNTQSATGILYVAVIVTFIGELTSQLLSRQAGFPL